MKSYLWSILFVLLPILAASSEDFAPKNMWYRDIPVEEKDYYVAFRGQWNLSAESDCEIKIIGASWFAGWLDGVYFCEGPARFSVDFPEYQTYKIRLPAGRHVLAIQVHQIGEVTRILNNPEPFLSCSVKEKEKDVSVSWKCIRLNGYESQVKRINPELGYIEWCDTRQIPKDWKNVGFNDSNWVEPVNLNRGLGKLTPVSTDNPRATFHNLKPMASGQFTNRFGYEKDDPAARFFLCDLTSEESAPDGLWQRYDMGSVLLMRPRFILNLPEGAIVEFAYSEKLFNGRVSPWITLSAGASCNMDHYVAYGGDQEFFPLTPKGGRFLEIHIYAPAEKILFKREEILERSYYGEPEGSFNTSDTLLNKIWAVGVRTLRSCSEDVIIDNPARERGQWTNDIASAGLDISAAAYSDLRLFRRCFYQSAQGARKDGLVCGLSPGGGAFLSTSAAQWVSGCMRYWELTGDLKMLNELFPYAQKNIVAFERGTSKDGIVDSLGWGFVDWGYVRNAGPSDMAVNLHYLAALQDMIRWCEAIGKKDSLNHYQDLVKKFTTIINKYYTSEFQNGGDTWKNIGYHRAILGMKLGFFNATQEAECIKYIKVHMLSCFPNNPAAPRLSDPGANNPGLITPYFGNYAMPLLIEHGEMSFVLDQYRKCWGWMLGEGRTTWIEVFDTRWSHCHQWAGCPTWQLSRYVLGLRPQYDLGTRHFRFVLNLDTLKNSQGTIPLQGGSGVITINWSRKADGIHYHLETPVPIYLHFEDKRYGQKIGLIRIDKEFNAVFKTL